MLLKSCGVEPIGVPLDEEGPRLDRLQRILAREQPRFFYTVPTFQNPTGGTMTAERRAALLWLAGDYGLTIVEDDIYRGLAYDPPPPPIKAQERESPVIYLDGFSKVLLPGVRIGFIVPPPPLRERLLALQQVRELCGPPLLQRALAEFLRRGHFGKHLERVRPVYQARRDATIDALERAMPDGVSWTVPHGGYCIWVSLPPHGCFDDLYQTALTRGVAFTPGEVFRTLQDAQRHLRLCFGTQPEDRLRKAVSTLATLVTERLRRPTANGRSGELLPVV